MTEETNIFKMGELSGETPRIIGLPTGIEGLDNLFFTVELKEGKPIKKPLGGIPYLSVINLTGVSDTGKSLMAEQYTVKQASMGYNVCFVTVEVPKEFLVLALKQRAIAMGINPNKIENHVFLIDAASNPVLRENPNELLKTLRYAITRYNIKSTVIDSITGLYEAKEVMARSIVRQFYNFMKKFRQTCLMVSQKRSSSEELTAEAAGGYAVSHIVDGSIVLYKKLIMSRFDSQTFNMPIGRIVRLLRIDGCRMVGHDTRTFLFEISNTGIVKIIKPLENIVKVRQ